eukprot:scaffold140_cov565-Prasinococcus_capsulatus_cf.AAC.17
MSYEVWPFACGNGAVARCSVNQAAGTCSGHAHAAIRPVIGPCRGQASFILRPIGQRRQQHSHQAGQAGAPPWDARQTEEHPGSANCRRPASDGVLLLRCAACALSTTRPTADAIFE